MNRIDQTEMMALARGLDERGIEYVAQSFLDGLRIRCKEWYAICNKVSYGHEAGLIEVMDLPRHKGEVVGHLTAKEVLRMVDEA